MGRFNPNIIPGEDGISHINMYSKGATRFGRMLSNFFPYSFDTLNDGHFSSVEGYWYYMSLPETSDRESLRLLSGYEAKKKGRELRKINTSMGSEFVCRSDFKENILAVIENKIRDNWSLWEPEYLGLPILHYYIVWGKVVDAGDDNKWLINGVTDIIEDIISEHKMLYGKEQVNTSIRWG